MDPSSDYHEYCTGGFDPDDIVITGMSGRFPECENVGELMEGVYQKKNLLLFSNERYEKGVSKNRYNSCGLLKNIDKLDADFFFLTRGAANALEAQTRIHMEVAYEAIVDAGYNPTDLKRRRIGVYNATTHDDGSKIKTRNESDLSLHSIRTMNANRTSYALDFIGPSHTYDSACSSSAVAFHAAVNDIERGQVEGAIVSGCQLNLDPEVLTGYDLAGIASLEGNSVPFDANSDGMLRTEAIAAIFIQKAKYARRVYAKVLSINYLTSGYVPEGISVPSQVMQCQVLNEMLDSCGVDKDKIDYIESHGTGTHVGDPIELNSMVDVFLKDRKKPMYVGSVKSNIGHTEASSGVSGIINAIFVCESGLMPPNIRYKTPNPRCPALVEGRLKVVTEPTPTDSPYVPVNSFGFGGTILVSMLERNPKTYSEKKPLGLPRLVLYSATTEESINFVFDYIKNNEDLRDEFFALLHKLSFTPPYLKPYRGFYLSDDAKNTTIEIKNVSSNKREVWFVMTGMGCQWPGMGLQLMRLDVFAQSMRKSANTLKPYGIDLFELLRADKNYLQVDRSITPAFVTIAAIQIALVDLLTYLGIKPDGIVGHSTGELICAYADGCCTAEQTILSAYWRGKTVEGSTLPKGAMAAVGLSWEKAQELCPEGIYPACDNAADSVTISGLKEPVDAFVKKLQSENIFARVVNAYGYAFHCEYIHPVAIPLRATLKKLIPNPKARSERWISSSYREEDWDSPQCKIADADYFVHNLMSSVRFKDSIQKIPSDAVTIEIGPHFLLQSILRRAIGSEAAYIGLMKRNEGDNVKFFFDSMGKLYNEGLDPKVEKLYPPVKFPVPRGTPVISNLIKWNHSQSYTVPKYIPRTGPCNIDIKTTKGDAYILDHRIDGRHLFPATGYVCMAWEALANRRFKNMNELPVVIENFKIHRATILNPQANTRFNVSILNGTGHFEIMEGNTMVASGDIYESTDMVYAEPPPTYNTDDSTAVSGKDLYNELKMAGYEYGPAFQSLLEINMEGTNGLVLWNDKWIPFLDCLLLFFGLIRDSKDFYLPTGALSFKIDPVAMRKFLDGKTNADETEQQEGGKLQETVPVVYNPYMKICRSVGVEISKLAAEIAPHREKPELPTTEEYKFLPYITKYILTIDLEYQFTQYMGVCNKFMGDIRRTIGQSLIQTKFPVENLSDMAIEEYLKTPCEEHKLLNIFTEIARNVTALPSKRGEWFSSYVEDIGIDVLNNTLINEDSLRIMLEIVSENTFRKLSVTEINRSFPLVLPTLTEMTKKYPHMKFKKTILVTPKELETESEIIEKNNIQLLPVDEMPSLVEEKNQDVIISSFTSGSVLDLQNLMRLLVSILKPNGFILLFYKERLSAGELFLSSLCGLEFRVHSHIVLEKVLQSENLIILSKISDPFGGALYLIRSAAPPESHKIIQVTEASFDWVDELRNEMYGEGDEKLWLVSQDSPTSGIIGMVNCLKQEPKGERIRCVFICQNEKEVKLPAFSFEEPIYKPLLQRNLLMNVWRGGSWGSFRHVLITEYKRPRECENSYVNLRKYGDMSSFEWVESPVKYLDSQGRMLVHIYYSSLNFKDVMFATGRLNMSITKEASGVDDGFNDCLLGIEFSGKDPSGKRVTGFVRSGGMATAIYTSDYLEIPDNWTLEQAATIPGVYATCYYAMIMRANLQRGESILIHSATGGIGIAAIRIALSLDCKIYATVGNDDKRKYLKKLFPIIKDENIGCSRNITFEKMVMTGTKGRGVDVVLNSLADEKFRAGLRCVARGGRFIEIGKYDMSLDKKIGLKMFLEDISFIGLCLDTVFDMSEKSKRTLNEILKLVREGIQLGVVQPLDTTVFDKNQVEDAFRYMAKGIHTGKVVLKIRDEEADKSAIPKPLSQLAVPNTIFYRNKVYIIIGGLGGFGIEVTKWLISKGGRHIILTSRYGARTPYHHLCLNRWRKIGLDVRVSTLNVARKDEAEKLLKEASSLGRVGGIFNSAVVLKDAFMDIQTPDDYKQVCEPKAIATAYLDAFSRKLCPALDYFVCFSSMSCGRGNAGQTNYGFANSAMERICEERRRIGLHGLSIQWGIIGEVGVVHRHMGDDAMIAGVIAQSVKSCLSTMDAFLQQDSPVVSSYMCAVEKKKSGKGDVLAQLAKVLGTSDISEINQTRCFGKMGIDSMVAVELKQLIESSCDVTLSMQEIQDMKVGDVKALLEKIESDKSSSPQGPSLFATTTLKLPATLLHAEPSVVLNADGLGKPVFILNIGDNSVEDFRILADVIDRPTYGIVWSNDSPTEIKAAASFYYEIIQNCFGGTFNLIASDISANLAFEIALCSQKSGKHMKSLTLLSGSEDLVNIMNKEEEPKDPDVTNLCRFVEQFMPGGVFRLEEELRKVSNLDQRIKCVINFITSASSKSINKNELSAAITAFLKKRSMVQSHVPSGKIVVDVNLIEDPSKVLANDVTIIKESFAQVFAGKVNVHRVCGIKDLINKEDAQRVANIIVPHFC